MIFAIDGFFLFADVCIFGSFGRLSPDTVHSADSRFDSRVKWWIHVSSIVTYLCKISFSVCWNSCKQHSESLMCCFWSTVSKCSTQFEHSFLIDKYSCNMVNTLLSDIYNFSAISYNFNLQSAKTSLWSFWCFPGQLQNLGNLSIPHHLCLYDRIKVSIPPLYHCFWWSRVRIALIKPLLYLNSIFSHKISMLYQHTKFRFFCCFENLQQ